VGEYTRRKSDNVEIKIGTCESMYYLRWDNRKDVYNNYNVLSDTDLRYRIPFPDEDDVPIGEYTEYDRSVELINYKPPVGLDVGVIIHKNHRCSNVKIPCYHGKQLELDSNVQHNFKPIFYLVAIKHSGVHNGLYPVIQCGWCNNMYTIFDWDCVLNAIIDEVLRERLINYKNIEIISMDSLCDDNKSI
jgi:hypothetical protein